ncbi:MAG TPA: hypothetical protein P5081_20100 [Phycisphaerae bacterium]|nr:hypothetical protein [Phycisphaerae bacterium]HRW55180.1 hypothetical protein [Phycisphaerae bacterium]
MKRVLYKLLPNLRQSGAIACVLVFAGVIVSLRFLVKRGDTEDRFGYLVLQGLMSIVFSMMHGGQRGLTAGGLLDPAYVAWRRSRPWNGSLAPFASAHLQGRDFLIPILLTLLLPLRWYSNRFALELTLIALAYFLAATILGWLAPFTTVLWKARHYWPIYLGVAVTGGLILCATHVAQVPLAILGLYCVSQSQAPGILRRAFVEDALRHAPEEDPWLKRRRRPGADDDPELPLDKFPLAPKFPVPSIPYALATGAAIAWLSFAPLNRFQGAELFRLYLMMSFGLGVVALAHIGLAWLTFRQPPMGARLTAGAWRPMQGLQLYATRFGSLALSVIAFSLAWKRNTSLAAPIALSLGAAWTLLRLRNLGLQSLRLTGSYQIA